jgi:hypothetical protein
VTSSRSLPYSVVYVPEPSARSSVRPWAPNICSTHHPIVGLSAMTALARGSSSCHGARSRYGERSKSRGGRKSWSARVLNVMRPSMRESRKIRGASRSCEKPTMYQCPPA